MEGNLARTDLRFISTVATVLFSYPQAIFSLLPLPLQKKIRKRENFEEASSKKLPYEPQSHAIVKVTAHIHHTFLSALASALARIFLRFSAVSRGAWTNCSQPHIFPLSCF